MDEMRCISFKLKIENGELKIVVETLCVSLILLHTLNQHRILQKPLNQYCRGGSPCPPDKKGILVLPLFS